MSERAELRDCLHFAMEKARGQYGDMGIYGYGIAELRDGDGALKSVTPFTNTITNFGDTYYCQMALVGLNSITAPTLVARMKLGTGSTAVSKATNAGEVIGTYISGSTVAFDASYPTKTTASSNSGAVATYKTTWAAGTATNSAITEASISSATADSAGTTGDTICRTVFGAINKTASDSLAITWTHTFKGA